MGRREGGRERGDGGRGGREGERMGGREGGRGWEVGEGGKGGERGREGGRGGGGREGEGEWGRGSGGREGGKDGRCNHKGLKAFAHFSVHLITDYETEVLSVGYPYVLIRREMNQVGKSTVTFSLYINISHTFWSRGAPRKRVIKWCQYTMHKRNHFIEGQVLLGNI